MVKKGEGFFVLPDTDLAKTLLAHPQLISPDQLSLNLQRAPDMLREKGIERSLAIARAVQVSGLIGNVKTSDIIFSQTFGDGTVDCEIRPQDNYGMIPLVFSYRAPSFIDSTTLYAWSIKQGLRGATQKSSRLLGNGDVTFGVLGNALDPNVKLDGIRLFMQAWALKRTVNSDTYAPVETTFSEHYSNHSLEVRQEMQMDQPNEHLTCYFSYNTNLHVSLQRQDGEQQQTIVADYALPVNIEDADPAALLLTFRSLQFTDRPDLRSAEHVLFTAENPESLYHIYTDIPPELPFLDVMTNISYGRIATFGLWEPHF